MAPLSAEGYRALAWGYQAMFQKAAEALLYIVNEAETKDSCVGAAQEALDAVGEPD